MIHFKRISRFNFLLMILILLLFLRFFIISSQKSIIIRNNRINCNCLIKFLFFSSIILLFFQIILIILTVLFVWFIDFFIPQSIYIRVINFTNFFRFIWLIILFRRLILFISQFILLNWWLILFQRLVLNWFLILNLLFLRFILRFLKLFFFFF